MSKRILGGIGKAMHGLGSDMAGREEQAARDEFAIRRDNAQFARQQSLARLQNQFATEREQRGNVRADEQRDEGRIYAKGQHERARGEKLEDDATARRHDVSLIGARARAEAANRRPDKPQYETITGADGKVYEYEKGKPGSASLVSRPVTTLEEAEQKEGGEGGVPTLTTRKTTNEPVVAAPKGVTYKIVPHPTVKGRFVQQSSNGQYTSIPDAGPDWDIKADAMGASATNKRTGAVKLWGLGATEWTDVTPPGREVSAPGAQGGGATHRWDPKTNKMIKLQ